MASPQEGKQVVHPEGMLPLTLSCSSLTSMSEDGDTDTMAGVTHATDDDSISILSMVSYPDLAGRKGITVTDDETSKTIYENRVFRLEADVYNRVQHLMDDKIKATNKTPFRRREWRMTDLLPERKKKSFFRRHEERPQMKRLFIVPRGEEVKTTKEDGGWRLFIRHCDSKWWRCSARETRDARMGHRKHFQKVNQRFCRRQGPAMRNVGYRM